MKATAKDLRFHSKKLLETVARGEEVIITYRGKPFAKLIPLEDVIYDSDSDVELFGIWADYAELESVDEYVRELRKGRF